MHCNQGINSEVRTLAMTKSSGGTGVTIGNVTGGIQGSIIAGRDVRDSTINIGGNEVPADKQPEYSEIRELLADIHAQLVELAGEEDVLREVSPSAPLAARSAEVSVKAAADSLNPKLSNDEAGSVKQRVTEATSFVSTILDGATSLTNKVGAAGDSVQSMVKKTAPLVEKLSVAALWISRLWLQV
jgi:hypothetical protein